MEAGNAIANILRNIKHLESFRKDIEEADRIIEEKYPLMMTVSELYDCITEEVSTFPKYAYGYFLLILAYIKEAKEGGKYLIDKQTGFSYLRYHSELLGKYILGNAGVHTDNQYVLMLMTEMTGLDNYRPEIAMRHIRNILKLNLSEEYNPTLYMAEDSGISTLILHRFVNTLIPFDIFAKYYSGNIEKIKLVKDITNRIVRDKIRIELDEENKAVTIVLRNIYDRDKDPDVKLCAGFMGIRNNNIDNVVANKEWITDILENKSVKRSNKRFINLISFIIILSGLEPDIFNYYKTPFEEYIKKGKKISDYHATKIIQTEEHLKKYKEEGLDPEVVMTLMLSGDENFLKPENIISKLII